MLEIRLKKSSKRCFKEELQEDLCWKGYIL
jgi:hypothetical protein